MTASPAYSVSTDLTVPGPVSINLVKMFNPWFDHDYSNRGILEKINWLLTVFDIAQVTEEKLLNNNTLIACPTVHLAEMILCMINQEEKLDHENLMVKQKLFSSEKKICLQDQ